MAIEYSKLVQASNTAGALTLNPQKEYTVVHLNTDGAAPAVDTIYFGKDSDIPDATPTYAEVAAFSDGGFALPGGYAVVIGPGWTTLNYRTAAGTPYFNIIAGPNLLARW